jgi:hypothetical protein
MCFWKTVEWKYRIYEVTLVANTAYFIIYIHTYMYVCVGVCVCARARTSTPYIVIGNVKFNTSNTNSPQTGYYLQAVALTLLPLIAIDTEQTDCIITHIGTLTVSRRHKLCTDMRHFRLPPPSSWDLCSSGLLYKSSGNFLSTFLDNLSVSSSGAKNPTESNSWLPKKGTTCCPENSVRN